MDFQLVLAISGASGSVYGKDIFDRFVTAGVGLHLIVSANAEKILKAEMDMGIEHFQKPGVTIYKNDDFETVIASGSFPTGGMVIAPCSMGCLARIAYGASTSLTSRAADVTLKERRPLILVVRETPLSTIHLENMLRLSRAGATILPAMPAFTHRPKSISDLAAFISGRVLDHLKIPQKFAPRYKGK
ncbi:MAG: flavin prenyltransferase UbiX [bacterium]|nr:MAG: flavin prenyltransferase UbiX [bacterium]